MKAVIDGQLRMEAGKLFQSDEIVFVKMPLKHLAAATSCRFSMNNTSDVLI